MERLHAESAKNVDTASTPQQRPVRPPVQQATAAIVAATRPGRIQAAAERVWTMAVLLGTIGLLTGWLTHDIAAAQLVGQATAEGSETDRREVAGLLHTFTLVGVAVGLLLETVLVAFLRRRIAVLRVLLSVTAVLAVVLLPLVLDIALVPGWRGAIIVIAFASHGLLAVAGSVLMWLPAGRPRAT